MDAIEETRPSGVDPEWVEGWFRFCDLLPIAAIATSSDGTVTAWSSHSERVYGFAAEEAVGRGIYTLLIGPTDLGTAEEIMSQVTRGVPWYGEFEVVVRDGSTRLMHVLDFPIVEDGAVVGVIGLGLDVSAERQEMRRETGRALEMVARVEDMRETERSRIATELHDELGQTMTALLSDLHWLRGRVALDDESTSRLGLMVESVRTVITSVQEICADLDPPLLRHLGLRSAIEELVARAGRNGDMTCTCNLDESLNRFHGPESAHLFRVVQECLTNAERHSGASWITVTSTNDSGDLVLRIIDDGCGIGDEVEEGFGIRSMRLRAERVGGSLTVESAPGAGTAVELRVPTRLV